MKILLSVCIISTLIAAEKSALNPLTYLDREGKIPSPQAPERKLLLKAVRYQAEQGKFKDLIEIIDNKKGIITQLTQEELTETLEGTSLFILAATKESGLQAFAQMLFKVNPHFYFSNPIIDQMLKKNDPTQKKVITLLLSFYPMLKDFKKKQEEINILSVFATTQEELKELESEFDEISQKHEVVSLSEMVKISLLLGDV